jgi:hypothetical protein
MTSSSQASKLPPFTLLDEPLLSFSPSDDTQVDVHPLSRLLKYLDRSSEWATPVRQ